MRVKHFGKEETEDLNPDGHRGHVFYGLPFSSSDGFAGDANTDNNEAMYLTDADMTFIQSSAGSIIYDETNGKEDESDPKRFNYGRKGSRLVGISSFKGGPNSQLKISFFLLF